MTAQKLKLIKDTIERRDEMKAGGLYKNESAIYRAMEGELGYTADYLRSSVWKYENREILRTTGKVQHGRD